MNFPSVINFGYSPVGEPSVVAFEISNTSKADNSYSFSIPLEIECLTIEPSSGIVPAGKSKICKATFTPTEATVLECSALLLVGNKESTISFRGYGKYPYIRCSVNYLDFGETIVGSAPSQSFVITNCSAVFTSFKIVPLDEDRTIPLFSFSPNQGRLEPNESLIIQVKLNATTNGIDARDIFRIWTPGGNTVEMICTTKTRGPKVVASRRYVNFGGVELGETKTESISLTNLSESPASFEICCDEEGFFDISETRGILPAKSAPHNFKVINISFTPTTAMVHFRRFFVVVGESTPFWISVWGSGQSDRVRVAELSKEDVVRVEKARQRLWMEVGRGVGQSSGSEGLRRAEEAKALELLEKEYEEKEQKARTKLTLKEVNGFREYEDLDEIKEMEEEGEEGEGENGMEQGSDYYAQAGKGDERGRREGEELSEEEAIEAEMEERLKEEHQIRLGEVRDVFGWEQLVSAHSVRGSIGIGEIGGEGGKNGDNREGESSAEQLISSGSAVFVTPSLLLFDNAKDFTLPQAKEVRIVNSTHHTVTCYWHPRCVKRVGIQASLMMGGGGGKAAMNNVTLPFTVTPAQMDIPPHSSETCTVSFSVDALAAAASASANSQSSSSSSSAKSKLNLLANYFSSLIECMCAPKYMRSQSVSKGKMLIPPWCVSVRCLGRYFNSPSEEFIPKAQLTTMLNSMVSSSTTTSSSSSSSSQLTLSSSSSSSSSNSSLLVLAPTRDGQAAFHTAVFANLGDTPLLFDTEAVPAKQTNQQQQQQQQSGKKNGNSSSPSSLISSDKSNGRCIVWPNAGCVQPHSFCFLCVGFIPAERQSNSSSSSSSSSPSPLAPVKNSHLTSLLTWSQHKPRQEENFILRVNTNGAVNKSGIFSSSSPSSSVSGMNGKQYNLPINASIHHPGISILNPGLNNTKFGISQPQCIVLRSTCVGSTSNRIVALRNPSRLPIVLSLKATEFGGEEGREGREQRSSNGMYSRDISPDSMYEQKANEGLRVCPSHLVLKGNEEGEVMLQFQPQEMGEKSFRLWMEAADVEMAGGGERERGRREREQGNGLAPSTSIVASKSINGSNGEEVVWEQENTEKTVGYVDVVGEGIQGSIRFDPDSIDFGIQMTNSTKEQTISVLNESDADISFRLEVMWEAEAEDEHGNQGRMNDGSSSSSSSSSSSLQSSSSSSPLTQQGANQQSSASAPSSSSPPSAVLPVLSVQPQSGVISARSHERIKVFFRPVLRTLYTCRVVCVIETDKEKRGGCSEKFTSDGDMYGPLQSVRSSPTSSMMSQSREEEQETSEMRRMQSKSNATALCVVTGLGILPSAAVVDVHRHNTEKAILWKELSLNQLNHAFAHELTPADETFNRYDGLLYTEAGMRLLQNLLHLPFYLGAAPLGSKDTEVFVCVQNNGKLPLDWRIRDPSDFDVRAEHWVEERDLRKGMMHQMGGMGLGGNGGGGASGGEGGGNDDDNGGDGSGGKQGGANGVGMSAISIEPREGHLETGEECVVRFSCNHHSEGMHQASFIWQLLGGGKQVVLEIACQTLSPTDAHVVFESGRGAETTAMHFLEQVPIGEVDAPMQSIVLRNEGGTSIDYRLDLTDVERLNASASDFPLFECPVTRGIVPAYGKQTIYWRFRPLMQRGYLVRIPIKLGSRYSSMSVMNANVGGGAGGGDGNVNGTNHSPSSNNGIGMGVGGAQGGAQGAAGGGSDGTEGITHMETVLQALLAGDGFIAKEGAEPLVDEKKTTIPAPLSPLPGQLCLLSHERVGFGSVAGGSIERRLVCLVCPRVRRHPALQKRAYEKGEKRGILFDWEESHPLIKSQVVTIRPIRGEIAEGERCVCVVELHAPIAAQVVDTSLQCNIRKAIFTSSISNSSIANQNSSSSSSSINGVGASSEVNQIFSYHRFPSARRSSSVNGTSSSSSVVASNFNSGSIDDHSTVASLSTQHSQLGKIKGLPSSSYPVPSQSSSSSSLAIAPHQPSIRKQPPRVSVIERMTKSRGIQIATRLEQFRPVLEKARNEENQFLLALARQPVDPLSAAAASTLQSRTLASGIPLNETTKQALEIAAQAKEEQKIRILQKEKEREEQYEREREAFGMYNLTPTTSAMKGTTRKNKGNLGPLRESRSSSAGGRRMTDADEVSGVNVSLPPLLNPSSGSSSGSGSVSVPLYSQQGIVQQGSMQSQGIQGIQGLIPTGAMNKQGSAVRLPPLGMQEPNEGGRGHEGRMSSKKEKFGGLDGLQDLDGDDLDGGMRGMLGEGEEDREWDDSFREPDQKIFLRVSFKSSSAIRFSELHGASSLLRIFLFQPPLSANRNGAISTVSASSSSSSSSNSSSSSTAITSNNTRTSQLSQLPFLTRLKEGPAEQLSLFRAASEELLEEMMKELTGTYPFLQQAHECLSFKKPCQFAALSSSHALPLKPMKVSEFAFAKPPALPESPQVFASRAEREGEVERAKVQERGGATRTLLSQPNGYNFRTVCEDVIENMIQSFISGWIDEELNAM